MHWFMDLFKSTYISPEDMCAMLWEILHAQVMATIMERGT